MNDFATSLSSLRIHINLSQFSSAKMFPPFHTLNLSYRSHLAPLTIVVNWNWICETIEGRRNVGSCHTGEFTSHNASAAINQTSITHKTPYQHRDPLITSIAFALMPLHCLAGSDFRNQWNARVIENVINSFPLVKHLSYRFCSVAQRSRSVLPRDLSPSIICLYTVFFLMFGLLWCFFFHQRRLRIRANCSIARP